MVINMDLADFINDDNGNCNNSESRELRNIIELEDCPPYIRLLAMSQIETKKDMCWVKNEIRWLKKLNMSQIALLISLLLSLIIVIGSIKLHMF